MDDILNRIPADALAVMERLEAAGYEAYLVGGCVRDLLLGRTPSDYDITTSAEPDETVRIFEGYPTVDIGKQHGTVGVIVHGISYEVTTYRVDGEYTDNRHPDSVSFTRNLEDDLARRDFTINALAMDRRGQLAECNRQGLDDLRSGVIRAVGCADQRFDEDALRILRGVRFSAQLGFRIEEETAQAIHRKRELLRQN